MNGKRIIKLFVKGKGWIWKKSSLPQEGEVAK